MEVDFGDFRIENLGEFEAKCEMALACESGPYRWGWLIKKGGRKYRDSVLLTDVIFVYLNEMNWFPDAGSPLRYQSSTRRNIL
jgi:hypothetical protein